MNDAEKIEALIEAGDRLESVLYSGGKGVVDALQLWHAARDRAMPPITTTTVTAESGKWPPSIATTLVVPISDEGLTVEEPSQFVVRRTPKLGDVVHYVTENNQAERAAIVSFISNEADDVTDLHVFARPYSDSGSEPVMRIYSVPYDPTKQRGTWHFPED